MAGKITATTHQINDNATATNNFVLKADNLGGLKLSRGNDGATSQDILMVDTSGKIATPQGQAARTDTVSMVRLNTANGYGSNNTVIRRFTNVITNQGSDITYADSATLGASFTINANGVYAIHYTEQSNTGQWFGPSLNSANLTTAAISCPISEILSIAYLAANTGACAATTVYLPSGSIVRPHFNAVGGSATPAVTAFTITRVS